MQKFLKYVSIALMMSLMFFGAGITQDSHKRVFSVESGALAVKAKEHQAKNQHKQAAKTLRKALKLDGLTAYETSAMNQMLGGSYFALEKHKKAI